MRQRLTDRLVLTLPAPVKDNKPYWDAPNRSGGDFTPGFGLCTAKGARSFILNYRTNSGRQRASNWESACVVSISREKRGWRASASNRRRRGSPSGSGSRPRRAGHARTRRAVQERLSPSKRPNTAKDYSALIDNYILPALGPMKVGDVTFADVDRLHRGMTETPYRANRCAAVLSKMFSLSIRWRLRTDNPARDSKRTMSKSAPAI